MIYQETHNKSITTEAITGLPVNYLLYVGERVAHKNFTRLLHCFAALINQHPGLYLICANGSGFDTQEKRLIDKLSIKAHCRQINVNEFALNYLYQQAKVFVFPSLYEGFGYPLLDAFKVGCAVAASNTSSFPEVGGDAVHYFNPDDTHSMYKAIHELLADTLLRKQYIEEGYEQLKHFAIAREIEDTLNFYTKVTGHQ
jgi:glycosyltransferase involved in cell wall biosynthesis